MTAVYLTSGAYQAKSVIANAQRCVNLYPEENPQASKPPAPVTHYMRPGKAALGLAGVPGIARGLYTASNGELFAVVNTNVYFIDALWQYTLLGAILPGKIGRAHV